MAHDGTGRDYRLPPAAPYTNEGKTVAGWVMFWGVCIGGAVTGLGLVLWEMWVLIAGLVILAVTVIASIVLSVMGMGQPRNPRQGEEPEAGQASAYR